MFNQIAITLMTEDYSDRINEIKRVYESKKKTTERVKLTPINGSGDVLVEIFGRDPYGRFHKKEKVIKKGDVLDLAV